MDIYIKPAEKVQLVGKREVLLRDVAEVFLSGQTAGEAERLVVFRIPEERKKTYLLSVVDLIQVLHRKYPNAAVNNVGETDILIEYLPQAEGRNPLWVWAKVAFVSLVLFVGASTTIKCFHSDTQLPLIFENMYYLFFRYKADVVRTDLSLQSFFLEKSQPVRKHLLSFAWHYGQLPLLLPSSVVLLQYDTRLLLSQWSSGKSLLYIPVHDEAPQHLSDYHYGQLPEYLSHSSEQVA